MCKPHAYLNSIIERLEQLEADQEWITSRLDHLRPPAPPPTPPPANEYEERFQKWYRRYFIPGSYLESSARMAFDALNAEHAKKLEDLYKLTTRI